MWTGYGYLNSTEIWNNKRTVEYLLGDPANGIAGMALPKTVVTPYSQCEYAASLFCDPPVGDRYTDPLTDDAPWYDVNVPESAEFAGLFVTDITGFDSVVQRDFTQGAIIGGSLGPLRLQGRTITVTGWLRASSCCGAEYGLRWLQEALIGSTGCDDCALGEMVMLKCCPQEAEPAVHDYVRTMQRVGLVDGPKVTDRMGTCCASCGCTDLQVQFTLASEVPYIFSEIEWCAFEQAFPAEEYAYDLTQPCVDCPEPPGNEWTPDCGPVVVQPPAPFFPDDDCYCDPWCFRKLCCTFENPEQWNDVTSYMVIEAGNAEIRNLKIVAYRNRFPDEPCPCDFTTDDWRCVDPCATLEIAQLPAGSTLTIDSRTRVVSLRLAGGAYVPGLRYLSASGGEPFSWFDIGHCTTLCLQVTVDCAVADDATISLGHVGKYLASGG